MADPLEGLFGEAPEPKQPPKTPVDEAPEPERSQPTPEQSNPAPFEGLVLDALRQPASQQQPTTDAGFQPPDLSGFQNLPTRPVMQAAQKTFAQRLQQRIGPMQPPKRPDFDSGRLLAALEQVVQGDTDTAMQTALDLIL